jgi:RimJ/RimL family protein N-acetyltransferase
MILDPTLVLENDRVRLQAIQASDYDNLLPFALHEPELWQYSLVSAASPSLMQQYIADALEERAQGKSYAFTIYDKLYDKYAGSTRYYNIQTQNQALQLGYTWYGKAFQGTGLNRHCKFLMLEYAFEVLDIERVELRADSRNQKSIKAMKDIGCTVEGVLRNNCIGSNGRRDSVVLSILKDEWFNRVKKLQENKLS